MSCIEEIILKKANMPQSVTVVGPEMRPKVEQRPNREET